MLNLVACSRVDRGEAMIYTVDTFKATLKNRHHFSRIPLAVLCTTNIVPKGSPLLVTASTNMKKSLNLIFIVSLTGLFSLYDTLASGMRDFAKNKGTTHEQNTTHSTAPTKYRRASKT